MPIFSDELSPEVRQHRWHSEAIAIGTAAYTGAGPFDPVFDIVIEAVYLHYVADATAGTAGTLDVGTAADVDAIVDAQVVTTTGNAGDTTVCTLAATLNGTEGYAAGKPVVPAGTQITIDTNDPGVNAAVCVVEIVYSLISADRNT